MCVCVCVCVCEAVSVYVVCVCVCYWTRCVRAGAGFTLGNGGKRLVHTWNSFGWTGTSGFTPDHALCVCIQWEGGFTPETLCGALLERALGFEVKILSHILGKFLEHSV